MDNLLNIAVDESWIKVKSGSLPSLFKKVHVLFDNGEKAIGYRYENEYRGGWKCDKGNGLFFNYIWSGLNVIAWQPIF